MNPVATSGAKTIAQLDVDDRDGYGPETITLSELDGTYQYRVHRFSSSGSLAMSGAVVKVYSGSSEPITISVPSDCDEWWDVFTIENGEIKILTEQQTDDGISNSVDSCLAYFDCRGDCKA